MIYSSYKIRIQQLGSYWITSLIRVEGCVHDLNEEKREMQAETKAEELLEVFNGRRHLSKANSLSPISLYLILRKIAIWMPKFFIFFKKNCHWQFFWKNVKFFGNFFGKMSSFLAIFWQSNGNFPEGEM